MSLTDELTPEAMAAYRNAAKRLWQKSQQELEKREKRAWELAHLAASLLKEKFGVTKVMVFGSLVRKDCFTLWSDVDIAAWGISPKDTFLAIGAVRDLDDIIEVNLVDVAICKPELLTNIEREGIML